jgi:hypothetical protein
MRCVLSQPCVTDPTIIQKKIEDQDLERDFPAALGKVCPKIRKIPIQRSCNTD